MASDILAGLKFQNQNPYLLRLLEEGTSTAPISSHWQGAARLANALLGGIEMGRQDTQNESARRQRMDLPGLEDSSMPANAQPAAYTSPSIDQTTTNAAVNSSLPASVRYNNPGAQYPGQSATAFGSTGTQTIGGGHKIATFDTPEAGAAAQFDLLAKNYSGMKVADALAKWSGGNNVGAYVQNVAKAGISPETVITPEFLRSPKGIQLAQAMAQHEAGRPYPMGPEQWQTAQNRAFADPAGQPSDTRLQAQRNRLSIPPQDAAKIKALLGSPDPANQALGLKYYEQATKPRDETRPLTNAQERARYGIQATDTNPYQVDAQGKVTAINPQPFAVNVNQQGASEFEKTYGPELAKEAIGVVKSGDKAVGDLQRIGLLRNLLAEIQTGKLAQAGATMGAWMQSVGMDPKTLGVDPRTPATVEAATALINKMALANIGTAEGGIPANNFSEADRDFIIRLEAKVGNRPEANDIILTAKERMSQLALQRADAWSQARENGTSYEKFNTEWRKKVQKMDVFGDLAEKVRVLGVGGGGPVDYRDYFGKK